MFRETRKENNPLNFYYEGEVRYPQNMMQYIYFHLNHMTRRTVLTTIQLADYNTTYSKIKAKLNFTDKLNFNENL